MEEYIIDTGTFQLSQAEFIIRLLVAIGMGALIGLEREQTVINDKTGRFAGIRTFAFVSLLGFIAGMAYYILSPWVYIALLLVVASLTGVSYWITASKGNIGSTTEFSLLIGFCLGTLSFLGFIEVGLMITVVVVVLLSAKLKLQTFIGKITAEEMYAFIRFIVMALLIFPFLPNRSFGPYKVINPHEIGWVILLTSGLGFVGYLLMKFMEAKKGILVSGIIGGLVSSTAVTWVFAKKSRENEAHSHSCAIAILAASSIMIIRVLVWIFIFNKTLFNQVYWVFTLLFLSAIGITLLLYLKQKKKEVIESSIPKSKPLDLRGAFMFGIIYTIILLLVSYANEQLGERGIMISSGIAGMSDIDAISITISKMLDLDTAVAAKAMLIAAISNTVVKMGIATWAGSPALKRYLYMGYGTIFVTALVIFVFLG
jgi:uncharacterized membrane protein (DUF4010 family)